MSSFAEIREQVLELLQRERRVAYRILKRLFSLDDEYIEDLKADLIDAKRVARRAGCHCWLVQQCWKRLTSRPSVRGASIEHVHIFIPSGSSVGRGARTNIQGTPCTPYIPCARAQG